MNNKFHREIIQIPSDENRNTAITQLSITIGENSVSNFGVANPQMLNGNTDTNALFEKANENAMQNIVKLSSQIQSSIAQGINIPLPISQASCQSPQEVTKTYNHSPNKPMSPNQKNTIESMAQRKNIDVESLSRQVTGKNFSLSSSADANDIIKNLKSR